LIAFYILTLLSRLDLGLTSKLRLCCL